MIHEAVALKLELRALSLSPGLAAKEAALSLKVEEAIVNRDPELKKKLEAYGNFLHKCKLSKEEA